VLNTTVVNTNGQKREMKRDDNAAKGQRKLVSLGDWFAAMESEDADTALSEIVAFDLTVISYEGKKA